MIYRLRLWSATVPARLLFSLADTLHCFKPQTLCLPFQSYYSSYPTFPFGTKHSFISALCKAPLLSVAHEMTQQTEAADRSLPVLQGGHGWNYFCCSLEHKTGPGVVLSEDLCLKQVFLKEHISAFLSKTAWVYWLMFNFQIKINKLKVI